MSNQPTGRIPRQRTGGDERRRSVVYGIPTLPVDRATGAVIPGQPPIVGYIGKSVQTVWQRQQQHRDSQPFSDLICGGSWPIEEGYWTPAVLAAREEWWIRHGAVLVAGQKPQRPVYNYEHNTGNPDRIEVWRAVEHRQRREPGWMPPAKDGTPRTPAAAPGPVARWWADRQRNVARWWVKHRARIAAWTALWLALSVGAWWLRTSGTWTGLGAVGEAAGLGSCAWAVIAWRVHKGTRPRRRRTRRPARGRARR
ncbi:hypothetical protein ABT336_11840 [Micromonospora sp. NPDC000207]|uniref:hypothetical protein n=1 Tax=Micromonospora sp. NPDC000207 TaxID=3154246 RepID=UPI00331A60A5